MSFTKNARKLSIYIDEKGLPPQYRRQSSLISCTAEVRRNMQTTTGASQLSVRQSLYPLFLVTMLFCMWGFSGGLMEVLNKHFQETLQLSRTQSTGLQVAFFSAYLIGPLTYSGWIVRRWGYRYSFITGLLIFGVGALLFWPTGQFRTFGGFCGAMFVMGSGLATLETSAIPFVATCGPAKWSELRLNLVQAIQSVCTVSGLLLASYVILSNTHKKPKENLTPADIEAMHNSLASVQWVYLGVALFAFILSITIFFSPIPEITDADMELQAAANPSSSWTPKPLKQQYTLFWGVAAAFCFTGAQSALGTFFINYVTEVESGSTNQAAAHKLAIAQAVFSFGRFCASFALRFVKPRHLLFVAVAAVLTFLALAIALPGATGVSMLMMEFFAKSCVLPTIFTLALKGLGRHTKRGGSFLVASMASGIVFAPAMGRLADWIGTQKAVVIPLAAVVLTASFPIYLNVCKGKELDAFAEDNGGQDGGDAYAGFGGVDGGELRRVSARDDSIVSPTHTVFQASSPVDVEIGEKGKGKALGGDREDPLEKPKPSKETRGWTWNKRVQDFSEVQWAAGS